jgi:hypothetical protein
VWNPAGCRHARHPLVGDGRALVDGAAESTPRAAGRIVLAVAAAIAAPAPLAGLAERRGGRTGIARTRV